MSESHQNGDPDVFVHPSALNDSTRVGSGTRIWAFAHVMAGAVLGKDCNIGECSFVESGAVLGNHVTIKNGVSVWDRVTLGDHVFVGPNAVFTNDRVPRNHPEFRTTPEDWLPTRVGEGATIGANATIICGCDLGPWSFVGAGAVVVRSVPAHALVVGNPARPIGWVCRCGQRLDAALRCPRCGRGYRETPVGLSLVEVDRRRGGSGSDGR